MQQRKPGKRGRPPNRKADESENESSESFSHKVDNRLIAAIKEEGI
jgi:hypothetical protein